MHSESGIPPLQAADMRHGRARRADCENAGANTGIPSSTQPPLVAKPGIPSDFLGVRASGRILQKIPPPIGDVYYRPLFLDMATLRRDLKCAGDPVSRGRSAPYVEPRLCRIEGAGVAPGTLAGPNVALQAGGGFHSPAGRIRRCVATPVRCVATPFLADPCLRWFRYTKIACVVFVVDFVSRWLRRFRQS